MGRNTCVQGHRFIDLFCGVGAARLAFNKLGGECVFAAEWDKYARETYKAWHGHDPYPHDLLKYDPALGSAGEKRRLKELCRYDFLPYPKREGGAS